MGVEKKQTTKPWKSLDRIDRSIHVEQEVLYREALAMNLDHNDEIVKRRLAQKMEFISDGLAESLQPTKEMLVEYYDKNKDNYKKRTHLYLAAGIF